MRQPSTVLAYMALAAAMTFGRLALAKEPTTRPAAAPSEVDTVKLKLAQFEMVRIRGGEVEIPAVDEKGNQLKGKPPVKATIKPFWMGRTEVAWEAYDIWAWGLYMTPEQRANEVRDGRSGPSRTRPGKPYGDPDRGFGHEGYPAIGIHWYAARKYCEWLSGYTGKKYRLPTEAEWEWACRAGGAGGPMAEAELRKVAWYEGNSLNAAEELQTHPVGERLANGYGLHDMLGNVWEWCECLNAAKTPIARGGSYMDKAVAVHPGARSLFNPQWQLRDPQDPQSKWWLSDGPQIGFRVVREDD